MALGPITRSRADQPATFNQEAAGAGYGLHQYSNVPERVLKGARQAAMLGGPGAVFAFMQHNGHPRNGAWCGEFAAAVMHSQGLPVPKNPEVASNWRHWGVPTRTPGPGDIAVRRGARTGSTGSHVMMIEKVNPDGSWVVIGGNMRQGWHGGRYNPRMRVGAQYASHFDVRTWPTKHPTLQYGQR